MDVPHHQKPSLLVEHVLQRQPEDSSDYKIARTNAVASTAAVLSPKNVQIGDRNIGKVCASRCVHVRVWVGMHD